MSLELKRATSTDVAQKAFRGFAIKDADRGEIEAVVATLNVVDKDGDIIRKGALGGSAAVTMSAWGHDAIFGATPAGKGTLVEEKSQLRFAGRVFLSTTNGRETFEVLKEMGEDQEWSFGFRVTGWEVPSDEEKKAGAWRVITKMEAFEVSPVLVGAGVNTRTTSIKQADGDPGGSVGPSVPTLNDAQVQELAADVAKRLAASLQAEAKASADAAAEEARQRAADEAAQRAAAEAETKAATSVAAEREFQTFLRTMRRNVA